MTRSLQSALREFLRDWRLDLASDWQRVLTGVEPDFEAVDDDLEIHPSEPIFPSRRGHRLPGQPADAHVFRAFDGLKPEAVRCVLLGQDPYPSVSFSTGRAFESGEHTCWSEIEGMPSPSMRSVIQALYAFRSGHADYALGTAAWPRALDAIKRAGERFPAPPTLAQTWVDQGVLLLNSSLTISRFSVQGDPHQVRGHLRLWRPVMTHLLRYFSRRRNDPQVVFILMGDAACEAGRLSGLMNTPRDCQPERVVATPHPAFGDAFLSGPNPFAQSNDLLRSLGEPPIFW